MDFIFENKLFTKNDGTLMSLEEALRVSLKGYSPISRTQRAKAYKEYKELYAMDKLRVARKVLFNIGNITPTNLVG